MDRVRCFGTSELYARYHDEEWGVPCHDDRRHFEMICLEGAQAGLSWETILRKREGYREVFHGFEPERVAAMTDVELDAAVANPAIVRHRGKIESVRRNARAFLDLRSREGGFDAWAWSFVGGRTRVGDWERAQDVPAVTPESTALSKALRRAGFGFVGPTTCYAYMQAAGLVDDHWGACWIRRERRGLTPPARGS